MTPINKSWEAGLRIGILWVFKIVDSVALCRRCRSNDKSECIIISLKGSVEICILELNECILSTKLIRLEVQTHLLPADDSY